MEPVRPLRDLFDDLANRPAGAAGEGLDGHGGDPLAALPDAGHPDLPDDLLAEALVSYAATAPPQVAEQLGPFVTAHSGVPAVTDDYPMDLPDPAEGLGLLDGAAAAGWEDPLALDAFELADGVPDGPPADDLDDLPDGLADDLADVLVDDLGGGDPEQDLDDGFGSGAGEHPGDDGSPGEPQQGLPADGWLGLDQDAAGTADPFSDDDSGDLADAGDPAGFGTGWAGPGQDHLSELDADLGDLGDPGDPGDPGDLDG
jgi:hypothetical protein